MDSLLDIYTLNHSCIEGSKCEPDLSNTIHISRSQAQLKGMNASSGSLTCQECSKITPFLYDSDFTPRYLCPPCLYSMGGHKRRCNICSKKHGCDSCGGKPDVMIWIDREEKTHENMLLLCARDRCMMPFGFYIENNSLACSCSLNLSSISYLSRSFL